MMFLSLLKKTSVLWMTSRLADLQGLLSDFKRIEDQLGRRRLERSTTRKTTQTGVQKRSFCANGFRNVPKFVIFVAIFFGRSGRRSPRIGSQKLNFCWVTSYKVVGNHGPNVRAFLWLASSLTSVFLWGLTSTQGFSLQSLD